MILLVGYGNVMRCDDAVGVFVARKMAEAFPHLTVKTAHQLNLELLEDAVSFDKIIFVDASESGEEVALKKIEPVGGAKLISSHHFRPELFSELFKTLYGKQLDLYLCTIRGDSFEIGNILSDNAYTRCQKAIEMLSAIIQQDAAYA